MRSAARRSGLLVVLVLVVGAIVAAVATSARLSLGGNAAAAEDRSFPPSSDPRAVDTAGGAASGSDRVNDAGSVPPFAEPTDSIGPSGDPPAALDAEPTRVVVAAFGIDLAVIRPAVDETYPRCDVAEFLPAYGLPGLPGVTYLYGHARARMFLPLLDASRVDGGAPLIGTEVELYTADRLRRRYVVREVHRHVESLDVVNEIVGDAVVLQTSETSRHSGPKLVVIARPVGRATHVSDAAARPVARPRDCGS